MIDLELPEEERWAAVIRKEKRFARRVAKSALDQITAPRVITKAAGWAFDKVYGLWGGRYRGEVAAWAEALDVSPGEATLLNCTYELNHAYESLFGCTAGIRWVKGLGMVHVRSMDWPLPIIGDATRLFWFRDGGHEFVSVGVIGFVGVLSGMVPGAYSVTINWAPPAGRPRFDFGPAFLLRAVLEDCQEYDEAVDVLTNTKLATPVFFTVCGAKKGQACVIERTHTEAAVRKRRGVLVQANHHVARQFLRNNDHIKIEDEFGTVIESSTERADVLKRELEAVGDASSIEDVASVLDVEPVCNDESYQQMAFCPRSGEVKAWRWLPG